MPTIAVRHHRWRLSALFYLAAQAQALWYVPFSKVLRTHGLEWLIPYAFAIAAIPALVSPMIGGALADEHLPPERLLGGLMVFVSLLLGAVYLAIQRQWGGAWVVGLLLLQQLAFAPTGGLIIAIIFASVRDPARDYGPIRVWATIGWMVAAPLAGFLPFAETSFLYGYVGAAMYMLVALFAFAMPATPPISSSGPRRWRDLLGHDTMELLRERDVRVVFIVAALFSMPLAAFYPFTPLFLTDGGETHATALMSIGQVTEVISAFILAPLLARFRLKHILTAGLVAGVARYVLYAVGAKGWVLLGVSLHGFAYMLYFVAVQLYLERRIAPRFRSRAQAFLNLMMAGIGNLVGALFCGWLRDWCGSPGGTRWTLYWSILAGCTAAVMGYFLLRFREPESPRVDLPDEGLPLNTLPGE
ncbi:MAG TPA: MFS transporter [Chthoniobacteraceae bacterium]|jgi:nucleoside transporter|nr:MFS transporter [Chthoniobacteraceae bacterium]